MEIIQNEEHTTTTTTDDFEKDETIKQEFTTETVNLPEDADDSNKSPNSLDVDDDQPISKNQLKKQRRHARWLEGRSERRKAEREKFKMKRRRLAAECECSSGAVPPPNKTRKMDHPDASDVKVVVDCGYDKLMNILDIKKLVKQIQRCYAENRRVEKPLQYYVCNFKDKTKNVFDTSIQGYKQWDVYFEGLDPEAKFGKENLVFLAAESPNILENIDPKKVYIIGGLVDHNHHKGVCFQNAVDKGWEHAQLPLGNNVQLKSRKVLTVNHVFEIMLQFVQCNSWQETISKVIPLRKQLTDCKTENEMTENSEEKLDGNEQNETV